MAGDRKAAPGAVLHVPELAPEELAALRRQDAGAFTRLVEACQGVVMGVGQTLGLRGADLDDAAAEAFGEVYRSLPRFEARSGLTTWVYRIAYRSMLHTRRKLRPLGIGEPDERQADARQESPDAPAERNELYQALWAAVSKLDPVQATAVDLYYRRDLSVEEIAKVLECPTGTVKTHLFRAREALRQTLARQETAREAH